MKILAIETSCDDTCIAIIKVSGKKRPCLARLNFTKQKLGGLDILSNIVSSQVEVHQKYGGVYPALAKREHQKNLVTVLKEALKKAKLLRKSKCHWTRSGLPGGLHPTVKIQNLKEILKREEYLFSKIKSFLIQYQKPKIDAIAITVGPGLEPCLWVGVNFAKALSYYWKLPIVPVNHIEAHILANFISEVKNQKLKVKSLFPAVCLVVSGGHTQLILMRDFGKYKILGETKDDAAGECFDKVARILGLGYPGGPAIAIEAKKGRGRASTKLPRPMIKQKNYDFSFSGLKTAVLYKVKSEKRKAKSEKYIQEMCYETQQAIIDVLIKKTLKAAKGWGAKTIILGGGVTANNELRKQFNYKLSTINYKLNFLVPPKNLCTDNAVMTAVAAYFNLGEKTKNLSKIRADANLKI